MPNCQVKGSPISNANTAPTNGAIEKYAPVRAAPRWRKATTNNTKLKPYAKNPTTIAHAMLVMAGICAPSANAKVRLTTPATAPLLIASQVASVSDTLRVRLLSKPHAKHAPKIANEGKRCAKPTSFDQLNTTAPATINTMPMKIRASNCSLNTNQANSAVNTASALSNSEAFAAGKCVKPHINNTGASTPPNSTAPTNHLTSCVGN